MLLERLEDCGEIWLKYISRAAGVYTPRSLSKLKRLMARFTMEIEKKSWSGALFYRYTFNGREPIQSDFGALACKIKYKKIPPRLTKAFKKITDVHL